MTHDETTVTAIDDARLLSLEGQFGWWLTLLHHPEPGYAGRRVRVDSGKSVLLGRESILFGHDGLREKKVSREHAQLRVSDAGTPHLKDLGSRNGTYVNGQKITDGRIQDGDILTLGGILLLLHWSPGAYVPNGDKELIGPGYRMAEIAQSIRKVAPHSTPVLIRGETGTGKELVARAIHRESQSTGKFFAVNCGGMPDSLLYSELFGHVKGAFSGADRDRRGLIESAQGGTLFLDEIGDASPALQLALLRFLQEGEIRKMGSDRVTQVRTRVIAATHQEVPGDSFREDLYARLSRWEIHLPPLRDRKEDLPFLIRHFMEKFAPGRTLHHRLAWRLAAYHWPRNVRELEGLVERIAIDSLGNDPIPVPSSLDEWLAGAKDSVQADSSKYPSAIRRPSPRTRENLRQSLQTHNGNVQRVARDLAVARNTLYRWFRDFDLNPEDYRNS